MARFEHHLIADTTGSHERTGPLRGDTNFPLRVKCTSKMGQRKKCPSKGGQALSLRVSYAILVRFFLDTYPLEGYTLP